MKKNNPRKRYASGSCLILAILLVTALSSLGQGTVMEKADFEKMVSNGNKALEGKAYRKKATFETFEDGKIISAETRQNMTEVLPPDKSRLVSISNRDGKERKFENITIGPRDWVRTDDGPWMIPLIGTVRDRGVGTGKMIFASYKNLGKTELAGVKVAIYEKIEKSDEYTNDSPRKTVIRTERYWIDDKGLIRQAVDKTETVGTKKLIRSTKVYEYDPKIKIEPPAKYLVQDVIKTPF